MNEAENRVGAMIAEFRQAIGLSNAILAERCALLAAELATAQAKIRELEEKLPKA